MVSEIRESRTSPAVEIASKRDGMEDAPNHRIQIGRRNSVLDPSFTENLENLVFSWKEETGKHQAEG